MTRKLYYEDPEIERADVEVVRSGKDERGYYAVLDQTCFYPEGGGQPADTGTIGETRVFDVQTAAGEIRHYTDRPLEERTFTAEIDWKRRWDHMQQHAGQHVLSAVFDDLFNMKTTSFHLGEERVSIDLNTGAASKEQLKEAEAAANAAIRKRIPIHTQWVTAEQAANMSLRKAPAVENDIRLVTIEEVDINACGGTHPKNTADIGMIKIIGTEKAKSGIRVYFLCGDRAFGHFHFLLETTGELVKQLNAPVGELTAAAAALLEEKAANGKEMKELRSKLLETEAEKLQPEEGSRTIERVFRERPFKEIQQLAKMAAAHHPSMALLFLVIDGQNIRFVCAKGAEVTGDMRDVLKELLALTDGKGGGNAASVQGGGKTAESPETFFQVFRQFMKNID